jgi:hypothetical protein
MSDSFDGLGDLVEFIGDAGGKIMELAADGAGAIAEGTVAAANVMANAASAVAEATSSVAQAAGAVVDAARPVATGVSEIAQGAADYAFSIASHPGIRTGGHVIKEVLELSDTVAVSGDLGAPTTKQRPPKSKDKQRRRRLRKPHRR